MKKLAVCLLVICNLFCMTACISTIPPEMKNEGEFACIVSINCKTILNNLDKLSGGKREFVPDDGVILKSFEVKFDEGATSFEVLQKACQLNNIQFEFSKSAGDSVYVEGINQIYEFDCGELSGWQYFVNNEFQSQGAGQSTPSWELEEGEPPGLARPLHQDASLMRPLPSQSGGA